MAEEDTADVEVMDTAAPETTTEAPQDLISFLRSSADAGEPEVEVTPDEAEGPADDAPTDAAETDATETETETEQPKPFDELTDDELSEHPKVKSLLARNGESMRQRTERETANRLHEQQQKFVATGEATQAFLDLVAKAPLDDNGVPKVDPKQAADLTGAFINRGVAQALNQVAGVLNAETGESFTLSESEKESVENAYARYQQTSDPAPLIRAWLKPYARHALDTQMESIKADAKKEARRELEAAAKTERAKTTTEERKGRQPTGVNGTPVTNANPWDAATDDIARNGVDALKRLGVSV